MSQAPTMPLFTDAYLADTRHLTCEQHGAYLLLIMATWRNNGQALPDDDRRLAQICGVTVTRWRTKIRPTVIEFFRVDDGKLHQKRIEKTWENVSNMIAKNRDNASKGGKAKALKSKETGLPIATIPAEPGSSDRSADRHSPARAKSCPTINQSKKELSAPHRAERVLSYNPNPAREEPACAMNAPAPRRAQSATRSPADEARELIARGLNPITEQPVANPIDGLNDEIPA